HYCNIFTFSLLLINNPISAHMCCMMNTSILFVITWNRKQRSSTLFPTRRSSNLRPSPTCSTSRYGSSASPRTTWSVAAQPAHVRSEEHTSELQSRENLVCRHLLEKKNCNHK